MSLYAETIKLQESLSIKVITKNCIQDMTMIFGTDVSYKKGIAQSSAVLVQSNTLGILYISKSDYRTYVSGLFDVTRIWPII